MLRPPLILIRRQPYGAVRLLIVAEKQKIWQRPMADMLP